MDETLLKRIEHFGSTAVPGLSAKPIIDILVEVTSLEETKKQIVPVLEAEGYEYFWRPTVGDKPPYYAWFIKRDSTGNRTHHIHMVEADSAPARHRQLCEAYIGLGDLVKAREHSEQALARLGRPIPATKGKLSGAMLRQLIRQLRHRAHPRKSIGRHKAEKEVLLEADRSYERLTEIYFFMNDAVGSLAMSLHAINAAEDAGPSSELASISGSMAVTAGLIGLHPLARAYRRQAREVAEKVNHDCDFIRSSKVFSDILTSGRGSGNAQGQSWGLLGQAECALKLGRYDEAMESLAAAANLVAEHNIGLTEEIRVNGLMALASLALATVKARSKPQIRRPTLSRDLCRQHIIRLKAMPRWPKSTCPSGKKVAKAPTAMTSDSGRSGRAPP